LNGPEWLNKEKSEWPQMQPVGNQFAPKTIDAAEFSTPELWQKVQEINF